MPDECAALAGTCVSVRISGCVCVCVTESIHVTHMRDCVLYACNIFHNFSVDNAQIRAHVTNDLFFL